MLPCSVTQCRKWLLRDTLDDSSVDSAFNIRKFTHFHVTTIELKSRHVEYGRSHYLQQPGCAFASHDAQTRASDATLHVIRACAAVPVCVRANT